MKHLHTRRADADSKVFSRVRADEPIFHWFPGDLSAGLPNYSGHFSRPPNAGRAGPMDPTNAGSPGPMDATNGMNSSLGGLAAECRSSSTRVYSGRAFTLRNPRVQAPRRRA